MAVIAYLRLVYEPEAKDRVLGLLQQATDILKRQEGFLDLQAYTCLEENELLGFITWESLSHHEACQRNPEWFALFADWSELLEEDAVTLDVKYCEQIGKDG